MTKRIICRLTLCLICFLSYACGPGTAPTQPAGNTPANEKKAAAPSPSAAGPAPLGVFKVEWTSHQVPSDMQAGKDHNIAVTVKNVGGQAWPSTGVGDIESNMVSISYHWLPESGDKPVVFEGARTRFPHDVAAGESVTVDKVRVIAPSAPGSYRLQLSLVQEAVSWFEGQGASTVTVPVKVK
jgi:hypothetical protein